MRQRLTQQLRAGKPMTERLGERLGQLGGGGAAQ
jgi:hypothetical protein